MALCLGNHNVMGPSWFLTHKQPPDHSDSAVCVREGLPRGKQKQSNYENWAYGGGTQLSQQALQATVSFLGCIAEQGQSEPGTGLWGTLER